MKQKLDAGFSIPEGVVSVAILTTIVAIAASLFTVSIRNTNNIQLRRDQLDAIERDLARVYAYNDNYYCQTIDSDDCGITTTNPNPGEDDYVPEFLTIDDENTIEDEKSDSLNWFREKCGLASDGSLSPDAVKIFSYGVVTGVNDLPSPDLEDLEITRSANQMLNSMPSDGSINSIFSYQVSYSYGSEVIRRVVLTPTIAAWCP